MGRGLSIGDRSNSISDGATAPKVVAERCMQRLQDEAKLG